MGQRIGFSMPGGGSAGGRGLGGFAGLLGLGGTGGFAGGVAATGRAADFCGVADLCCTNQTRKDSSEIVTPIAESDSTMMRTEVPAALSRTSTVLYGSSMVALPVRFAFASAINFNEFALSSLDCSNSASFISRSMTS
jgi:hypothetical protein